MKGINIQFDTLLQFIEKNASNQDLLKSRDSFELIYQKVTQETFKIIALVFDNIIDDQPLKISFNKLSKQLKAFIALKPDADQDDDDLFKQQFDEILQFMNNRKPVMTEVDSLQRGDIVKFLFQAENKEKDMEEFMGNIKNIGGINGVARKLKTLKNIAAVTQTKCIETQTSLNMEYLERIQKKMPTLFRIEEKTAKCNSQQMGGLQNQENMSSFPFLDLDGQIDQIIKQKVKQAEELAQTQKLEKQKQKEKEKSKLNQKQKQKLKNQNQQAQAKRKKLQSNLKRNSELPNSKRSNAQSSPFKTKSGFNNEKTSKKGLTAVIEEKDEEKTAANSTERFQGHKEKGRSSLNRSEIKSTTIQSAMPSFEQIFSTLAGVQGIEGISQQQLKIIYESIKSSAAQTLIKSQLFARPTTLQQYSNTTLTYPIGAVMDDAGNLIEDDNQYDNSSKRMQGKNFRKTNSSNLQANNCDSNQAQINERGEIKDEKNDTRYMNNTKGGKYDATLNRNIPNDLLNQHERAKHSTIHQEGHNSITRNGLPKISSHYDPDITNKLEKSDSTNMLSKEGKSAEDFLKILKDTKNLRPVNLSKSINKENYTLDMYKSKLQNKNRASEHTNLPSLGRNASNPKAGVSLHEEGLKSPYLKRNINLSSNDPLFPSTHTQSQGFFKKGQKGERGKQVSKEQQKIMKELQRIVKEGSVKSYMKHIAMYVQFVESVHVRKCGERCVHLERFYQFLRRNNLPNRKELILHRTDMNVNVEI